MNLCEISVGKVRVDMLSHYNISLDIQIPLRNCFWFVFGVQSYMSYLLSFGGTGCLGYYMSNIIPYGSNHLVKEWLGCTITETKRKGHLGSIFNILRYGEPWSLGISYLQHAITADHQDSLQHRSKSKPQRGHDVHRLNSKWRKPEKTTCKSSF